MRLAIVVMLATLAAAASSSAGVSTRACQAAVDRGPLPVWARGGFSDPVPRVPHVVGRRGEIAAILFGHPLHAPPGGPRSNKILWVARRPYRAHATLRISARRIVGLRVVGRPVSRTLDGGPGPSIVDLPTPGCWRLTLRWSSREDTLDLRYVRSR